MFPLPFFIPGEQVHKPFVSSYSSEVVECPCLQVLIILAMTQAPWGDLEGLPQQGTLSHSSLTCRTLQTLICRGICPSGYHKGLFWAESWHERALPVNNVRIKDIMILINLPRPMFSEFIFCIELKP